MSPTSEVPRTNVILPDRRNVVYLRNAWYVADWSVEIERSLTPLTILGENIVLYRSEHQDPIALEDACCHRKLPLSMGALIGDRIQCGYHGLEYDSDGACVKIPGQRQIPSRAKVRSYPVVDRWGLIWIWMGDPAKADASTILHVDHYDDPDWGINRGPAMDLECNYLLMLDNLLDPSHVTYVHRTSLGSDASADIPLQIKRLDEAVVSSRWILDHEIAPFFQPYLRFSGNADRLQYYEVRLPSHSFIKDIVAPAGSGAPEGKLHRDVFLIDSYNLVTPVTEHQSRYFWFQLRNFKPHCQETTEKLTKEFMGVFEEDLVVLSAVDKGMRDKATNNIDIAVDAGGNQFRRLLSKRIEAERSQAHN